MQLWLHHPAHITARASLPVGQDPTRRHASPTPSLSVRESMVSSSLENRQAPAGNWEEDAGFERRAAALRSVASASGWALPGRPSVCPARLPPHLPLAAWPSPGRLPQPQAPDTARNEPPGAAVAWRGASGLPEQVLGAPVASDLSSHLQGSNLQDLTLRGLELGSCLKPSLGFEAEGGRLALPRACARSCLTLGHPVDCSPQAPLSMGFSRQECWSG